MQDCVTPSDITQVALYLAQSADSMKSQGLDNIVTRIFSMFEDPAVVEEYVETFCTTEAVSEEVAEFYAYSLEVQILSESLKMCRDNSGAAEAWLECVPGFLLCWGIWLLIFR